MRASRANRPVEHHRHVLVRRERRREAIKEHLHRLGVYIRQDQRERIIRSGLHSGEDVGECEALVGEPTRPLAALPPDMAGAALLADPRFILKEQAHAFLGSHADQS